VKASCGNVAGTIEDVWVDQSEPQVRYYQVKLASGKGSRLLPVGYVQWPNFGLFGLTHVIVKSITAAHFDQVPTTKSDAQITLLEEDKIMAYYAGGHLYATPDRSQPIL
jgi:photosynthetic reaction center H subunit